MADNLSLYSGAAITASGSSSAVQVPLGGCVTVGIVASAVSGTTPSATFEIQWSFDGTNWGSADGAADTFAAITAAKSVFKNVTVKAPLMRLSWTVTGTTPSFTTVASAAGVKTASTN
jgi:hypothetical protein